MEISQNFQAPSICSELNLNIQDLNIQNLLTNSIYRRLYNIVVHDPNKSQYEYRKNLIKQLYFLLKITPIIKPELQQSYLQKLQKWYNLNDHKKTQLGSGRLRNLINEYVGPKQATKSNIDEHVRPQSGVNWNRNVSPFLRPYTAKRTVNNNVRPQSYKSKFGQSTKASQKLESYEQISIRDFALSIRQQFEVSRDFINKNRTIHPQSQPIYEQLFNIIKKAGIRVKQQKNEQKDEQNEILFQRDKQEFLNQADNMRVREQPEDEQNQKGSNEKVNNQDSDDLEEKISEESQKDEDLRNDQDQTNFQRKIYLRDQNIAQSNKQKIQGFNFVTAGQNQSNPALLKKVNNKYLHITNNKFVNYSKDDNQIIRSYVNYTRVKSAMKKQFNRKSQTKRLLSAKIRSSTNAGVVSSSNLKPTTRIYSALPKRKYNSVARNSNQPESQSSQININKAKVFDFSQINEDKENISSFISSAKYNQRHQLDKLYRKQIQNYKKFNKKNISATQVKCKQRTLLTKYDCFLPQQRINPIADIHIKNHNQEALKQIEKIKEKVSSLGKKCVSTDSLMKALYIDSYNQIGSFKQLNGSNFQSASTSIFQDKLDWKTKNVFFNMISNGQKKMKKKTRKLHKK